MKSKSKRLKRFKYWVRILTRENIGKNDEFLNIVLEKYVELKFGKL